MEDPIGDNPVAREPCRPGTVSRGKYAAGNHAAGNGDFDVDGVDYGPVLQIVNKKVAFSGTICKTGPKLDAPTRRNNPGHTFAT